MFNPTISQGLIDAFKSGQQQLCKLTVTPLQGSPYTLTENNIYSLVVDRYTVTSDEIQVGTCCSSELEFVLNNQDYSYSDYKFEGARIKVEIGADVNGVAEYITLGQFTVDYAPRNLQQITINALDNMARFDKYVDSTELGQNYTPMALINMCCNKCGLNFTTPSGTFPNEDKTLKIPTDVDDLTYRQLLIWVCQVLGGVGYCDLNGNFTLDWYNTTNRVDIDTDVTYSSDIYEKPITITGFIFTTDEEEYVDNGESHNSLYCIDLTGNKLIESYTDIQTLLDNIGNARRGMTYTPYSASVKSMPYLMPLDGITLHKYAYVYDYNGISAENGNQIITENSNNITTETQEYTEIKVPVNTIITNYTFTLNGGLSIEAKGTTEEIKGYATYGALTPQQSEIIQRIDSDITETESTIGLEKRVRMEINAAMYSTMGFYETKEYDDDNVLIAIYSHNQPLLANSTIVYKTTIEGLAWTNNYKGSATVWQYGTDVNGNAVFNTIVANNLSANYVRTGTLESANGTSSLNLNNGTFSFGKKTILGTVIPVLSLDTDGYLSMYGKLRSHLADDYCGFITNGFGFFDDDDKVLGVGLSYCAIEREVSTTDKGFVIRPYTANNNLYKSLQIKDSRARLQHGTMSGQAYLELSSSNSVLNPNPTFRLQGNSNAYIVSNTSGNITIHGNNAIYFTNSSGSAYVTSDGTVYAPSFETTSDRELKKNIVEIKPNALEEISKLKFYEYDFKDNDTHQKLGIMANDSPYEITGKENKSINQYAFTSYVARAIQELNEKVDNLEKELRGEN